MLVHWWEWPRIYLASWILGKDLWIRYHAWYKNEVALAHRQSQEWRQEPP